MSESASTTYINPAYVCIYAGGLIWCPAAYDTAWLDVREYRRAPARLCYRDPVWGDRRISALRRLCLLVLHIWEVPHVGGSACRIPFLKAILCCAQTVCNVWPGNVWPPAYRTSACLCAQRRTIICSRTYLFFSYALGTSYIMPP